MTPTPNRIAEIAAVIGDPARAAMLSALMDGRALTASELAGVAGVTPQTASTHLARLLVVELVKVERQGRHHYHRLANSNVAHMLESLMQHASGNDVVRRVPRTGPRDEALRRARTCYDHLGGRLAVAIADSLVERGCIEFGDDAGVLTDAGSRFFAGAGIALRASSARTARPICRPCLDWSERRPHLAGQVGAAICRHGFEKGWLRLIDHSRAVAITRKGESEIAKVFGISQIQ